MRVLTWNLFHGRAVPGAGRELLSEYAAALERWEWDIALLQEVPPWWPRPLGAATGAAAFSIRTSRNEGLLVRRSVARRWPDLIKSNGGGANLILVRHRLTAGEHHSALLRRLPERRRVHGVRIAGFGWAANLHAQGTQGEASRALQALTDWADPAEPLILGGDFNLREPQLPGLERAAGHGIDLVFARGWMPGATEVLEHGRLSDHDPVAVSLRGPAAPAR